MPDDYQCSACGICFSVGWFHYHAIDTYCAETYLVCAQCGTWHAVRHAYDRTTIQDQLCAHPGPMFRKIDPEQIIVLQRRRAENERWLAEQQARNRSKRRWIKLRPAPMRVNLMPDSPSMRFWNKFRSALEIIGGILVSPLLLILVLPILLADWYRSRHPQTFDPDQHWSLMSSPSEVVLPHMQAVSRDTESPTKTKLAGILRYLSASHLLPLWGRGIINR